MPDLLFLLSSVGRWGLAALVLAAALILVSVIVVIARAAWLRERIEGAFRRSRKPGKDPGRDHYYRPYWVKR